MRKRDASPGGGPHQLRLERRASDRALSFRPDFADPTLNVLLLRRGKSLLLKNRGGRGAADRCAWLPATRQPLGSSPSSLKAVPSRQQGQEATRTPSNPPSHPGQSMAFPKVPMARLATRGAARRAETTQPAGLGPSDRSGQRLTASTPLFWGLLADTKKSNLCSVNTRQDSQN